MNTVIFHIDVNSAFLSWSAVHKLNNGSPLDLRTVPSVIGGDSSKRHGIVLAKSIPARKFQIKTGEPIVHALRKCPNLIIEPPDHEMYESCSAKLMALLMDFCPEMEQVSIDECYLDYSQIAHRYSSYMEAAILIKETVCRTLGFTVNIGISDRKVLAKMASDFEKPNLIHTLFSYEIASKMWPMPVDSLYMCGKSSVEVLKKLGITTIGDLAKADPDILTSHLKSHGKLLWEYANGIDTSNIEIVREQLKGIGNSTTMVQDAVTYEEARKVLLGLCETVSHRLRESGKLACMISVEIKYSTFQSVSHQKMLAVPANGCNCLFENACILFQEIWNSNPVRLLGVRTSKLVPLETPIQLSLFDTEQTKSVSQKQLKADRLMDEVRNKYGSDALVRGSLYHKH